MDEATAEITLYVWTVLLFEHKFYCVVFWLLPATDLADLAPTEVPRTLPKNKNRLA